MWEQIEQELAKRLRSKPYSALNGAPAYKGLFGNEAACKAFAKDIVFGDKSDLRSGIREYGITGVPRVDDWRKPLFRAFTPEKNNPNGRWWFDSELLDRWSRNVPLGTPNRKQKIMESIRPMLAVSKNWNGFEKLQMMELNSPIPVIVGQGAHKNVYAPDEKDPDAMRLYEENKNVFFIGGYPQVFVPIVNEATTHEHVF